MAGRSPHERKKERRHVPHEKTVPADKTHDGVRSPAWTPCAADGRGDGRRVLGVDAVQRSSVVGSRPSGRTETCCTTRVMEAMRLKSHTEQGFMGMTHALSACALVLALIAFAPLFMERVLGVWQISFVALLCLALVGGALMPDLDNTNSSANSALGFVGDGISAVMRATAPMVKNMVHTKYDKDLDNPHRSFYHTGASAILVGGLGAAACAIPGITGKICAMVLAFVGAHVALSTLLKSSLKKAAGKSGKLLGALMPLAFSIAVVAALWFTLPKTVPYWEIGVAFGVGWLVHILGDMCTTSGVPILWPVPIRGKMWYDVRLLKIKAGGVVENVLFIPLFTIIIIVSVVVICTSHVYH